MTPQRFVSELSALRFDCSFNPYSDCCPLYDGPDAPATRFAMLTQTLSAAVEQEVDAIWVGRDLGYRGGRRTGLAFTDDLHLANHQARWGIKVSRPTKGEAVAERAAKAVWTVLDSIDRPVLLWNVFPLHPHEKDRPFTNRLHTAEEARAGLEILRQLIELVRPRRLLAIGNDAEKAAKKLSGSLEVLKVRHPSYGGQIEFTRKTRDIYASAPARLL